MQRWQFELVCSTFLRQHRQLRLQQPLPSLRHSAAAGTFARGGARVSMAGWNIYDLYIYIYNLYIYMVCFAHKLCIDMYTIYIYMTIYVYVLIYIYIYICSICYIYIYVYVCVFIYIYICMYKNPFVLVMNVQF